jgi:hypothetical protein
MTGSKRGRTATSGRTPSPTTGEPLEPANSSDVPRATEVERSTATAGPDATAPDGPRAGTPLSLTIRLPFLTATLTGPQRATAAPALASSAAAPRSAGATLEKLAFYGGVATMGALGALDWPVAFAVAAGTWVAQHTPPVARTVRSLAPREPAGTSERAAREPAPAAGG